LTSLWQDGSIALILRGVFKLENRSDNHTNDGLVETDCTKDEIQNLRRRAFIKRLAKVGAIAPAAVLLHDASANAFAVGD
jgi:hypothetical protein